MQKLQSEYDEYDSLFKKLSKQMHSVVTHMSAPEVERVMSSMKRVSFNCFSFLILRVII